MIRDADIHWRRIPKYYRALDIGGLIVKAVNESGSTSHAEGVLIASPTDTDVVQKEIGSLGLVGVHFPADTDIYQGYIPLPHDLDLKFDLGFRLHWTNSGGASAGRGVTWLVKANVIKQGVAYAQATTALDTAIGESLVTVASGNEVSARGVKNSLIGSLTREELYAGAKLTINIQPATIDAGVANLILMGIDMDYMPHLTKGIGNEINAIAGEYAA